MSTKGIKQVAINLNIKRDSLLILLFLFLWSQDSWALWPFKYEWSKIKSEHFVVLTSKEHKEYGLLVSEKAEQAFQSLQIISDKHPKKTYIIIDHTKNFSNGSATFFPYPIIRLQPNTPSPYQSVGQYDDWLYELLVHEYTHILSFHNARGFYRPLRWLFGSTISPGYFMPLWYLEGLAVNTESFLSDGGRLRSSRYQSFLNNLHETNISYANEQQTGRYPFGAAPYIYGGWINQHAAVNSKKSPDPIEALGALHKNFSLRLPYLVSSGFHASTGVGAYKSFEETFSNNNQKNRPRSKDENQNIGEFPQWSFDHEALFYLREDEFSRDRIYQLKDGKEKLIINFLEIAFFRVTKDFIYFVTSDIERQDHQVFNLRSYDFKTKKIKQITEDYNIHNFDIFEGQIAFVRKNINKQQLILSNLKDLEKQKVLYTANGQDRISLPTFIKKQSLAFAVKKPKQKELLIQINLNNQKQKVLQKKEHINFIGTFKDKAYFLFEEQGIKYLSRGDLDKALSVPQGLLSFDIESTNKVYTSLISSKGPLIDSLSLKELKRDTMSIKLPEYKREKAPSSPIQTEINNYNSFTKLTPHYVMPIATVSPYGFSGDFLFGLSTGSQDPLALNTYNLSVFTDTVTDKASATFDYTSAHFRMPLSFSVSQLNTPLNLNLTRTSTNASFGTSYTFNSNIGQSFRIGSGFLWSEVVDDDREEQGEILRGGPFLSFDFQDAQSQARELAPREGYQLRLAAQYFAPLANDYIDYLNLRFGARKFFKSPLVSSHRLVFGLDGQWNDESLPFILTPNSLNQLYRNASMGDFTLRGAPTGAFLARDWFAAAHIEYRFPMIDINWGPGLLPAFLNRITGAFTGDYAVMEGANLLAAAREDATLDEIFIDQDTRLYSAGVEVVFEGKAFYHVPASLQIGIYQFLNKEVYDDNPELFVGFSLTGF